MSRTWLTPSQEDSLLTEVAQRRQRLAIQTARVTPIMGQMANVYADAYPWMDADVTGSFLQAGVAPDDPRIQQVASLAAQDIPSPDQDNLADSWWDTAFNAVTGNAVGRVAKAVVRGGLTALSAPMEELQALLSAGGTALFDQTDTRDGVEGLGLIGDIGNTVGALFSEFANADELVKDFWTNYTTKAARSGLGLAIGDLIEGNPVDLGAGFLPGGSIYAQREQDKNRLQLDGTFVTPGRLIARQFIEPGTGAYSFLSGSNDFAMNLFADPSVAATGGLSKLAKADRLFRTAGGISGVRKTVSAEKGIEYFLTSKTGQKMAQWLTDTTDVRQIWEATGRADLGLAQTLAGKKTTTEVMDVLSNTLGTVIREKPTANFLSRTVGGTIGGEYGSLFGGGAAVRRKLDAWDVRFHRDMPGTRLDAEDINRAAVDLTNWMRTAKMGDEAITRHLERLAAVAPGDQPGVLAVAKGVMADADGVLVGLGVKPERAKALTTMIDDLGDAHRTFNVDDLGREVDTLAPLRVNMGGETLDASPTAGIIADLIYGPVPLPDAREIRRATPLIQRMERLYSSGLWKAPVDFADSTMQYWKYAQLLRGAYTVRVIGEEQVRLAASGFDSLASSPLRAMAWIVSVDPSSRLGKTLARGAKKGFKLEPRGVSDIKGNFFDDVVEHTNAMSRGSGGHAGLPGEITTGRFVRGKHGDAGFHRAWAARLGHVGNDPVMRRVAGGLSDGDIKSIGAGFKASGSNFDDVAEWFWRGGGKEFREKLARAHGGAEGQKLLGSREAADGYLRQNFFEQFRHLTGDDQDLISMIATGKLDDIDIHSFGFEEELGKRLSNDYDHAAPNYVPMEDRLKIDDPATMTRQRVDAAVERMFGALMSNPTNSLSRSPAFRQMYWQRVEELLEFAPRAVQEDIVRMAREANLGKLTETRMAGKILKGEGTRLADIDDVDILAKSFALDGTKKLLYDLSKRNQFFDMARILFPFGEAWKEIMTSWGRIMYQNPKTVRRAQQIISGGRGGDQDPSTGIFHTDPTTGEEVFCVDDSTEALTRRGWVRHTDLSTSDELLTLDPDTDTIQWLPVQSVHLFDWSGDLVRWSGMVDALTTPNHRWLVEDWRTTKPKPDPVKRHDRRHRDSPHREFKTTEWLSAQKQRAIVTGGGTPTGFAYSPTVSDELVELVGWVVTEGTYDKRSIGVSVSQSQKANPDNTERIRRLAKHFAAQGATATEGKIRRAGEIEFYFGSGIAEIVRAVAPEKEITPGFVRSLTVGQARLFLDTLIAGDGHTRPNGHRHWIQQDSGRVDGFQMLCAMLGIRTRDRMYGQKHSVWVNNPRHTYTLNARPEHYDGVVWCPRVATGVWMARRNGATYWTGNTYPGGAWLSKALLGTDKAGVEFVGRAAGLNVATATVLPGFGPAIQLPASWLIPNTPKWDTLHDVLLPFGEEKNPLKQVEPAWLEKVRMGIFDTPESSRMFGNTVMDVMRALHASGEYPMDTQANINRLLDDARKKARVLYLIRGVAQSGVPTGPSLSWTTTDVQGNVVPVKLLSDELRRMTKEEYGGDRNAAFLEWTRRFGVDNVLSVMSKSQELVDRPVTSAGDEWLRANPGLERDFPMTVGLFAPQDPVGEFDYSAYLRQIESGARQPFTPEEMAALANDFLGRLEYEQARNVAAMRPGPQSNLWLAQVRDQIAERRPGFDGWIADRVREQRPDVDLQIRELTTAVTTQPALAGTDAGRGTIKYLTAVRLADQMARGLGGGVSHYQSAKAAAPIRLFLRQTANEIIAQHPDFAHVWTSVFERELADD